MVLGAAEGESESICDGSSVGLCVEIGDGICDGTSVAIELKGVNVLSSVGL